jgi:pilus assembly protein CpaB
MNSSVLRILAALLAIGAIAIGYMGYQAGRQPQTAIPAPAKAEPPKDTVILAAREITAGHVITAEDLTLGHVPTRPVRAYGNNQDLIGKKPKVTVSTGEMLLTSHFPSHSQLAQSVNPGERAVAVKIDEVIGTGGFLEPGDRVDVLLFLHADTREIGENSSAQVVLSDIRVLAFGNILEPPVEKISGKAVTSGGLADKTLKTTSAAENEDKEVEPTGKSSKTAVLAVPAAETTKLMLADSSGKIRLALHGVANEHDAMLAMAGIPAAAGGLGKLPARFTDNHLKERTNHFMELRELTGKKSAVRVRAGRSGPAEPYGPRAVVHKGSATEVVILNQSGVQSDSKTIGVANH